MLSHVGALASAHKPHSHVSNMKEARFGVFTFQISHIRPNIGIQGVDHHFPACWPRDFHSSVYKTWCRWSTLPSIVLTDMLCLWQEIGKLASVNLSLANYTALQESLSCWVEGTMK